MHTQTSMLAVKVRYFYSAKETISRPAQPSDLLVALCITTLPSLQDSPQAHPSPLIITDEIWREQAKSLLHTLYFTTIILTGVYSDRFSVLPLSKDIGSLGRVSLCMGKLCLQGADVLPGSLLCSQGNERRVE